MTTKLPKYIIELAGQGYFVLDPGAVMGYYKKEQMFTKRRK